MTSKTRMAWKRRSRTNEPPSSGAARRQSRTEIAPCRITGWDTELQYERNMASSMPTVATTTASATILTTEQERVKASGPGAQNTSAYLETENHAHEIDAGAAIPQLEAARKLPYAERSRE